jgi:hypothetical protein
VLTARLRRISRGARAGGLALVVCLSGCEPSKVDLDVRGHILDAATGEPLVGASVALLWTSGAYDVQALGTASGSDGAYRLFVLQFPCDAVTLTAALAPYESETKDVRCTDAEQYIDFRLRR